MTAMSIDNKKAYCKKTVKVTTDFRRLDVEKTNS